MRITRKPKDMETPDFLVREKGTGEDGRGNYGKYSDNRFYNDESKAKEDYLSSNLHTQGNHLLPSMVRSITLYERSHLLFNQMLVWRPLEERRNYRPHVCYRESSLEKMRRTNVSVDY